jgi:hypothetical protein
MPDIENTVHRLKNNIRVFTQAGFMRGIRVTCGGYV